VLDRGVQRARTVGAWRRAWALHDLTARSYDALGKPAEAAQARGRGAAELQRVRQAMPAPLREGFAALPDVRATAAGAT
jgi:hypothetical protein